MNEKGIKVYFLPFPLLILVIFLILPHNAWSARLFVKPGGGGSSCTQSIPCTFTTALSKASPRDTIFFSHGEYKRTAESVLRIEKDIFLYGGWDGLPSEPPVVNPELHSSVLNGGNLRPVIQILGPIWVIINGFTIQNGNANATVVCEGVYPASGCGGGIYIVEAEAIIDNNKILHNTAVNDKGLGGGIHLERASGTIVRNNLFQGNQARVGGGLNLSGSASTPPLIQDNRFIQNNAVDGGGGIAFDEQANPTIQANLFDNNSAQANHHFFFNGTGIQGEGNSTITRNLFQNHLGFSVANLLAFQGTFNANRLINNATMVGMYLINGIPPHPTVSNNFFVRSGTSSALFGVGLEPSLNAVIEHNTLIGEGIGTAIAASGYCILSLNNNIISGFPIGIDATQSLALVARHTLFDGSVTTHGTNVNFVNSLVGDPAFKDPAADDFHIKLTSAARDAGTANFITTTEDFDGDPRPIGRAPDIGADEFQPVYLYLPLLIK